ncbi:hypothetical protein XENORESO_006391, partial [Xenotaenia resolanae]
MMMMLNLKYVAVFLPVALLLGVAFVYLNSFYRLKEDFCDSSTGRFVDENLIGSPDLHLVAPDGLKYPQPSITHGRTDIVSLTPWLAPIVWEGTFNPVILDSIYQKKNISIAATVFAVGKYIMFLKNFLETAEQHFFVGFRVNVYVFTDRPKEVPEVKMAAGRE